VPSFAILAQGYGKNPLIKIDAIPCKTVLFTKPDSTVQCEIQLWKVMRTRPERRSDLAFAQMPPRFIDEIGLRYFKHWSESLLVQASEPGGQRSAASPKRPPGAHHAGCIARSLLLTDIPIRAGEASSLFRGLSVPTVASRTPPWQLSGSGCRGRRLRERSPASHVRIVRTSAESKELTLAYFALVNNTASL
jgi:hypothetical protein